MMKKSLQLASILYCKVFYYDKKQLDSPNLLRLSYKLLKNQPSVTRVFLSSGMFELFLNAFNSKFNFIYRTANNNLLILQSSCLLKNLAYFTNQYYSINKNEENNNYKLIQDKWLKINPNISEIFFVVTKSPNIRFCHSGFINFLYVLSFIQKFKEQIIESFLKLRKENNNNGIISTFKKDYQLSVTKYLVNYFEDVNIIFKEFHLLVKEIDDININHKTFKYFISYFLNNDINFEHEQIKKDQLFNDLKNVILKSKDIRIYKGKTFAFLKKFINESNICMLKDSSIFKNCTENAWSLLKDELYKIKSVGYLKKPSIVIGCFDFIKSITVSYDIQPPSLNIPDEDLQVIGNYLQSRSNGKNEFYEISNSLSEFISIHDN